MAKFKHKLTGDIVNGFLYNCLPNGLLALKKEMPLLNERQLDNISKKSNRVFIKYKLKFNIYDTEIEYETLDEVRFLREYEPYEEEQDSNDVQALKWLKQGLCVYSKKLNNTGHFKLVNNDLVFVDDYTLKEYKSSLRMCNIFRYNDWQIYEEPLQVKVTKLPHEFTEGEEVLVKNSSVDMWKEFTFDHFNSSADKEPFYIQHKDPWGKSTLISFKHCIPYVGNEHLDKKKTNCESGKIPEGYSAHKPKLGDDDYWKIGDEVEDLSTDWKYTVYEIYKNNIVVISTTKISIKPYRLNGAVYEKSQRRLYHKGSTVNPDGTVNEFVPWRVKYEQ